MQTIDEFVRENCVTDTIIQVWESNTQFRISWDEMKEIVTNARECEKTKVCLYLFLIVTIITCLFQFFYFVPILIVWWLYNSKKLRICHETYIIPMFIADCNRLKTLFGYEKFPDFDVLRSDIDTYKKVHPRWEGDDTISILFFRFTEHDWSNLEE